MASDLNQDFEKLLTERRQILKSLETFPDIPLIEKSLASCILKLFSERLCKELAAKRLQLYQNLDLYVKPTNQEELQGFFNSNTFSFESFLISLLGEDSFKNSILASVNTDEIENDDVDANSGVSAGTIFHHLYHLIFILHTITTLCHHLIFILLLSS